MKKSLITILVFIILLTGGYLYVRFSVLKPVNFKPDNAKARSMLDLRPRLIAKLQQTVKDASNGLYNLSIEKIEPHVSSGGVDMVGVKIIPDSAIISTLKSSPSAPLQIFRLSVDSFHVDGIGIEELLNKNSVDLKTISLTGPVIEMFAREKTTIKDKKKDTGTLYLKLMKHKEKISINQILVEHGTFIYHNHGRKNETVQLDNLRLKMDNILIDSAAQSDKKRFLFAEEATISFTDLKGRTKDSLYTFKCGSVNLSTRENHIIARHILVEPRYNRKDFQTKIKTRKYMYTLSIPELSLSGINWGELADGKRVIAREAFMKDGECNIYLDRSLPFRNIRQNNFPDQILMRAPFPFLIGKTVMHHTKLLYSEHNPAMDQTGSVTISDINGTVVNVTNIPAEIRKNRFMISKSSGAFMNRVPISVNFRFDLSKYKTGKFAMDLKVSGMDSSVLNPITGPLAEFIIRRGSIQEGVAHLEGDNFTASGRGMLLYKDLYLVSIKKGEEPGTVKKKKLLSFIGNILLVKNANPGDGKAVRKENFHSDRNPHQTFFSLVWKTIFIGILKTIGLPSSFANKKY